MMRDWLTHMKGWKTTKYFKIFTRDEKHRDHRIGWHV